MQNLMRLSIQTSWIVSARDSMLSVTWATCDRPHYLQCALVLSGAYTDLSEQPSKYSLIHFYKRCVLARPRILSLQFIRDQ